MSTTKKMPSSLGKDGQPGRGSEFVIPNPHREVSGGFLGIKTGKIHARAAIVFIGREITADDVIKKIQAPIADPQLIRKLIDQFLDQLQDFKIGNVISISYAPDGSFTLSLETAQPITPRSRSLP